MLKNITTITARTSSGFFGFNELHYLSKTDFVNLIDDADNEYLFDFSSVEVWDISVLMWLIIGLHHFKQKGIQFRMKLPMSNTDMPDDTKIKLDKSADYLRRWKFDEGLRNITSDVSSLLVPEQLDYFTFGPLKYYLPSTKEVTLEDGMTSNLISRGLGPITNLVDLNKSGRKKIENKKITDCISEFEKSKISHILYYKCNIPLKIAKNYVTHLLAEALNNVLEHPDATVGLVAVSVLGGRKELVLTVVDNGRTIPSTIYDVFKTEKSLTGFNYGKLPEKYSVDHLSDKDIALITDFATLPGVTSKGHGNGGFGLTYIKSGTKEFEGSFEILTDSIKNEYSSKNDMKLNWIPYDNQWSGNLLRMSIPIKENL